MNGARWPTPPRRTETYPRPRSARPAQMLRPGPAPYSYPHRKEEDDIRSAHRAGSTATSQVPGQTPKQARLPSDDLRLCQAWLPGQNGRCQNRPLLHRGQLRSSLTTRLAAANGAASALSRAGLPMQAVPALSALLIRRARLSPLASLGDGRPRRHATERGTRQDQPQSRQTLSYSAASQSTRIFPLYPPTSGLKVQPVLVPRFEPESLPGAGTTGPFGIKIFSGRVERALACG